MDTPLQITFRGFGHTPEFDQFIQERVVELEATAGHRMTSCHVVVELEHPHHQKAPVFHARIDLTLPGGGNIAASHEARHQLHAHEDPFAALTDAFHAARRQVEDWERRRHGEA
jgi:ribosome-associated translation inhibitor RaiA